MDKPWHKGVVGDTVICAIHGVQLTVVRHQLRLYHISHRLSLYNQLLSMKLTEHFSVQKCIYLTCIIVKYA